MGPRCEDALAKPGLAPEAGCGVTSINEVGHGVAPPEIFHHILIWKTPSEECRDIS